MQNTKKHKYNDYEIILIKKNEIIIHTENGYENINKIDLIIKNKKNEYKYEDYIIKGDLELNDSISKYIIDNINEITFDKEKFIGEIQNNKLIENKKIEKELTKNKKKQEIINIYEEYLKDKTNLKYEAFLDIYFSTNEIPMDIIKNNIKNKLNDYNLIKNQIKKEFLGKAYEYHMKTEKYYEEYEKLDSYLKKQKQLENRLKICNVFLEKTKNLEKTKSNKSIKNMLNFKKQEKIFQETKQKLIKEIEIKSKKDIFLSYPNITLNEIKQKINNQINILKKEIKIIKTKTKEAEVLKQKINEISFDSLYERIEKSMI